MVIMKKVFALIFALLTLAACGGNKDNPDTKKYAITGVWELSSVATKASVGSTTINVYVEFASSGNFTLYQKLGEGRYTLYTGSYTYSGDVLSGKYSSGASWGPYNVTLDESTLVLSTEKEKDTYKKIESIPSSVISNTYQL